MAVSLSAALANAVGPGAALADDPQPPRDLYGEAPRGDQVILTWRPSVEPPPGQQNVEGEHYHVIRDGQVVAVTDKLRFVDRWLGEQTSYSYVIRAIDVQGRAAESPPLTVTTPAFAAGLELGPYLQQLSHNRVVVVWQTFVPATTSLYFGPAGGAQKNVERDAKLGRQHAVIVSGLSPQTTYSYRWESDGRIGPPAEFQTPPANPPQLRFGVIGDFGNGSPAANGNIQRLKEDTIDFAITTGDNAYPTGSEASYRAYVFGPLQDFMAKRPFWPSVGNHDYYGGGIKNYLRYFALPGTGRYYSFSYGSVFFLSLDSHRITRRQRIWARRKLASSSARCKVAFFHHPIWSSGRGYRNSERRERRHKFVPLLQRGGVDLVLTGHVHNYERSRPLRAGRRSRKGIVYVVTGGGGAGLHGFTTRRRPRWSKRRGVFHHRLRVTAKDSSLRVQAIDTTGRTRDRFVVPCR